MKTTITLTVLVTLDVPEEFRGAITRDDLIGMARSALPDSTVSPRPGFPDGVQVEVEGVCQEFEGQPVFADIHFIEHDITSDPDIEFEDEDFTDPKEAA